MAHDGDLGARIDEQLRDQIQTLLRTAGDQHLIGPAGTAEPGELAGDGRTQLRLAVGRAVLAQRRRQVRERERRHRAGRRQAEQDLLRCVVVGVAGHREGDERGAAFLLQGGEAPVDTARGGHRVSPR